MVRKVRRDNNRFIQHNSIANWAPKGDFYTAHHTAMPLNPFDIEKINIPKQRILQIPIEITRLGNIHIL